MRLMWMWMLLLGCSGGSPAPLQGRASSPPPAMTDAKCAGDLAPRRATLVRDRPTGIARGVSATYRGRLDDSRLSLEVAGEAWSPDPRDTAFHALGEHCVRVVGGTDDRLEIEVALQPAHKYDGGRCHVACCRDHTPGPDGSIECCFCSDAP